MTADMIALVGDLTGASLKKHADCLGIYTKRAEDVNGKPSYVKKGDVTVFLWHFKHKTSSAWVCTPTVANTFDARLLVDDARLLVDDDAHTPDGIKSEWRILVRGVVVAAPTVRAYRLPAATNDDVEIVGARTPAERDAEGRKRAISLDSPLETIKRPKTVSVALQMEVAKARSTTTAGYEKRYKELAQPAFDEYLADTIDATELDRRKAAARATARAEYPPLDALDEAYATYDAAVAARMQAEDAAEKAVAQAHAHEDEAEAKVRELCAAGLSHIAMAGAAGPSGVVKGEAA